MIASAQGSRVTQGLGLTLTLTALAAAVVFPGQTEAAIMNSVYSLVVLGGVVLFLAMCGAYR